MMEILRGTEPLTKPYDFKREQQLLELAKTLQANTGSVGFNKLRQCLKVVQIGDFYDLWVGCEPYVAEVNTSHQMQIDVDQIKDLDSEDSQWLTTKWIRKSKKAVQLTLVIHMVHAIQLLMG